MKVFSKGYKNKSTPSLNSLVNVIQPIPVSKSKNPTKIKTFKQILTQNAKITARRTDENQQQNHSQNKSRPKTQRNRIILENSFQSSINTEINSFHHKTPTIRMISSVNCRKVSPNEGWRRESEQNQRIQSAVYYGKQILEGKALNSSSEFKDQNETNCSSQNINKLNISCRSQDYSHGKMETNRPETSKINKENQCKRINYYKNSKINNINKLTVKKKWSLSSFKIGKKIGRGRFGSVHIVQQRETEAIFALKKIDLAQVKEEQMESQIMQQIKLQLFMNYPNIIKLYGFFREDKQLCLILEYAEDKCLFSKLAQKIEERQVSYYTLQMIKALRYCHSQSILHRDLKPENILLCFGVAKLADFGWAAYAPKYKRNTFCGTLDYVPPQIIKGNYYDEKVDIWSLGVLMYQMAIGYAPFQTHPNDPSLAESMTMKRIVQCDLRIPLSVSHELRKLIESILSTQPSNRPSLEDIENSTWMHRFKEEGIQISRIIWDFWTKIIDK